MNQALHAAQQLVSFVDSLIVPVAEATLLMPVSAISEVIDHAELTAVEGQSDWCYGTLGWRDQDIMVVSYEALIGGDKLPLDEQMRFAVIKASDENSQFDFYAIVIQGYPRSARITPTSDFRPQGDQPEESGVLMNAALDDQQVIMPDLAYIEAQLQQG